MTPLKRWILPVLLVVSLFAAGTRAAELSIDVTKGNAQPLPIAIAPLYGAAPDDAQLGSDIANVVSADLERSGLFKPIDR